MPYIPTHVVIIFIVVKWIGTFVVLKEYHLKWIGTFVVLKKTIIKGLSVYKWCTSLLGCSKNLALYDNFKLQYCNQI